MGGQRISLSGAIQPPDIYHSYRFDSAIASLSGRFTALFEKLGTKALLLDHGKLSRELNRSYYCADLYEYPISFLSLLDGTEAIAHITARPNWPLTNSYSRQSNRTAGCKGGREILKISHAQRIEFPGRRYKMRSKKKGVSHENWLDCRHISTCYAGRGDRRFR
jgi:hypothetical protein